MTAKTLLGHLAQFGSFSTQSEVLCTQGLAYLLQTHKDAHSALADEVETRTGIAIGNSITWLAEPPQDDGARDRGMVVAHDDDQWPLSHRETPPLAARTRPTYRSARGTRGCHLAAGPRRLRVSHRSR